MNYLAGTPRSQSERKISKDTDYAQRLTVSLASTSSACVVDWLFSLSVLRVCASVRDARPISYSGVTLTARCSGVLRQLRIDQSIRRSNEQPMRSIFAEHLSRRERAIDEHDELFGEFFRITYTERIDERSNAPA